MKFQYAYRDSKNERHEGVIVASSKDDAFKKLRAQGVKPFFIVLAPGAWNRIQSFGKRGIAIAVLSVVAIGAIVYAVNAPRKVEIAESRLDSALDSQLRRQPIGDAAVIDEGVRTGWEAAFPDEGERFLASFAIPGVPAGVRSTTDAEIEAALSRKIESTDDDSIEVRQVKAMVEGMKNELRKFLAAGGTIKGYGRRLVRRQEEEIGYYQRAKAEIENARKGNVNEGALRDLWKKRNDALRQLGIKLVPFPEGK